MREVVFAIMMLVALIVRAQHNEYGVSDELVSLCKQVENNKYSPDVFLMIDTLQRKAQKLKDIKAQGYAYKMLVETEYTQSGSRFDTYCAVAQKFAREHKLPKYYYETAFYKIKRLSLSNKELSAFQESNNYLQEAIKEKYAYGQALMLRTFAETKYIHGEFVSAIPLFHQALRYELDNIHEPDMNAVNTYMQLGRCYLYSYKYEDAEPVFLDALKIIKSPVDMFEAHALLAQVAFMTGQKEKFYTYYHQMENASGDLKLRFSRYGARIKIYHHLLQGENEKAYDLCMSQKNLRVRDAFLTDYYTYLGDYENAFKMTKSLHSSYSYGSSLARRKDIAGFISEQSNELLVLEANRLQTDNNQLILRNTNIELESTSLKLAKAKAQELVEQTLSKNMQMQLNKREAELRKAKIDNEKEAKTAEEERISREFTGTMFRLQLLFLALIMMILIFIVYRKRRSNKQLKQKNMELTDALQRIKEADAMKDKFIAKNGVNLTEPLEALAVLSKRVATSDNNITKSERLALNEEIEKNTNKIIQLLDSQL